jgi:hypothetical protein
MATVQLAGVAVSGTIQGLYGTYTQASDGTYTVDTRDAPSLLQAGMAYLRACVRQYNSPTVPAVAAAGQLIASAALSTGALAVAHQPDVPRQGNLVIGNGTAPVSAGSVSIGYTGNDGNLGTDTFSCVGLTGAISITTALTRGIVNIATAFVTGLTGGTSPYVRLDTTAYLAVPVDPNAIDFKELGENVASGSVSTGTISTVTLGCISPTSAPNSTLTYGFLYSYKAPTI